MLSQMDIDYLERINLSSPLSFHHENYENYIEIVGINGVCALKEKLKNKEHTCKAVFHYMNKRNCYKLFSIGLSAYDAAAFLDIPKSTAKRYYDDYLKDFPLNKA